jgi:outer membrane protein OmpA-like peptidoglycan-associated protein
MIRVVRKHKAVALVFLTLALLIGSLSPLIYKRVANLEVGRQSKNDAKSTDKMQAGSPAKSTVQRSQNTATPAEPVFDIVRIDPISGISVLAGQAPPNSTVTVLQDGVVIGTAKVDENGEWALATEYKFAAEPRLTLRAERHAMDGSRSSARSSSQTDKGPMLTGLVGQPAGDPQQNVRLKSNSAAAVQLQLLKNLEEIVSSVRQENARREEAREANELPKSEANTAPTGSLALVKKDQSRSLASVPGDVAEGYEASRVVSASPPDPNQVVDPPRLAKVQESTVLPGKTQISIPIPVLFVFREATFTIEGRKAVSLLLDYLKLKRSSFVSLTGHADERGSDKLNMDLSMERLSAVAKFLHDHGFHGELELIPKGKTEPYTGVDRSLFALEDLYQLDRRVELRLLK